MCLKCVVDGKEENVEEIKASEIIRELQHVRASIDSFLGKFEKFLRLDGSKIVADRGK